VEIPSPFSIRFFFNQLFLLSPFVLYKIQGLESEREQQGHLIHCQLCVAKGELQMASDSFKIVLDEDGNNVSEAKLPEYPQKTEALHEHLQISGSRGLLGLPLRTADAYYAWQMMIKPCPHANRSLSSSGLTGVLSPSIAKLTTLQQLLLNGNSITGGIPQEFGNLSSLTTLNLGRNNLSGLIPDSLGHLPKLEILSLEGNYIYGEIPLELGNLSNLKILSLGTNYLSGSIPDSFGHLRKLQKLDLRRNRLSGKVPTLSDLQSLNYINLADNNLDGDIPVQLLQVAQYEYGRY